MKTNWTIINLADEVIKAHEIVDIPIDPLLIAARERIRVGIIDHSNFLGKIEYHKGIFLLYHPPLDGSRYTPRVRFSIAHELGHFYIPEHRERLRTSRFWQHRLNPEQWNTSDEIEYQADQFAGALLMPTYHIEKLMGKVEPNLEKILNLTEFFNISVSSSIDSDRSIK